MKSVLSSLVLVWSLACGGGQQVAQKQTTNSSPSTDAEQSKAGDSADVATNSGSAQEAEKTADEAAPEAVVAEPAETLKTWLTKAAEAGSPTEFAVSAVPKSVVDEIRTLIKPLASHQQNVRFVYLMPRTGGVTDLAVVSDWQADGKYWKGTGEVVFALIVEYRGAYKVHSSAKTKRGIGVDSFALIRRDIDQDAQEDVALSFEVVGDHERSAQLTLFLSKQRGVATLQYGDSGGEGGEGWHNYPTLACFMAIDDQLSLVIVKNKETTQSDKTTTTTVAEVHVQANLGAFIKQPVYAVSFARNRNQKKTLAQWHRYTGIDDYPTVDFLSDSKGAVKDIAECPSVKEPAFVIAAPALYNTRGRVLGKRGFHTVGALSLSKESAKKKQRKDRQLRRGKMVLFGK